VQTGEGKHSHMSACVLCLGATALKIEVLSTAIRTDQTETNVGPWHYQLYELFRAASSETMTGSWMQCLASPGSLLLKDWTDSWLDENPAEAPAW